MINNCRVCNHTFPAVPLLTYPNMPSCAQHLPTSPSTSITLNIHQCPGCGLVQLSNDPVHYYKEVIRAVDVSPDTQSFRTSFFSDFIDRFSLHDKKILEVGCGTGEYLSILDSIHIHAYGIEYSQKSVSTCIEKGLNVSQGFITNTTIPNSPFDAFFIFNYLEHLPDPNSVLTSIHNHLSDGAVGIVEVPNFDMILRNNLFSEFIIDHLTYFTRSTLTHTLNQNGFDVLEFNEICNDYILSAIVQKRKPLDLSHFAAHSANLSTQLHNFISQHKKVAIWGAGHQAFTIIALASISKSISYIVDSAPFKQHKFTPSTHIPILPPSTLSTNPVDAIIVMSGSYSNEIIPTIHTYLTATTKKRKCESTIHIAVVRDTELVTIC